MSLQSLHHRRERPTGEGPREQERQDERQRQRHACPRQEPAERVPHAGFLTTKPPQRAEEAERCDPRAGDDVDRRENATPRTGRQCEPCDEQADERHREHDPEDLLDRPEVARHVGTVRDHQRVRRARRRAARERRCPGHVGERKNQGTKPTTTAATASPNVAHAARVSLTAG